MNARKNTMGLVLTSLFCVAAALAALILVPSSPALLVDEAVTLLELDVGRVDAWSGDPMPLLVTGYAASIAVGAVLAVVATALLGRTKGVSLAQGAAMALASGLCALLGSHWMYCAVRWSYIINDLGGSWAFPVQFWEGGYTMYGALLGGVLGCLLCAKLLKASVADMLDVLIPGMLIVLVAGRVGEAFTSQGVANTRAAEALQMLPFAFTGEWGDAELSVYAYEAIAAAAALIAAAVQLIRRQPAGRAAETGLIIISAWQLLFESMRGDELIKFGFVCLNMLMAAGTLAFIITLRIIRCVRAKGWSAWQTCRIVLLLLGAGLVIAIEFALDGKIQLPGVNNTMLYAVDALAVTGMMLSVLIADGRGKEVR